MNKKIINQRSEEILREIEKLTSTIRAMERCDVENTLENFELLSTDAALRAELITCRLRHLVYSSTSVKKQEYLASAGVVQGIEIFCENDILEITFGQRTLKVRVLDVKEHVAKADAGALYEVIS